MIAWRRECLLISIKDTNYLPYPQLEALPVYLLPIMPMWHIGQPVYLSFNTTLSNKLLILLLKSYLCHPKEAQFEVYLNNVGAI